MKNHITEYLLGFQPNVASFHRRTGFWEKVIRCLILTVMSSESCVQPPSITDEWRGKSHFQFFAHLAPPIFQLMVCTTYFKNSRKVQFLGGKQHLCFTTMKKIILKTLDILCIKKISIFGALCISSKNHAAFLFLKPNEDVIQSASKDNKSRCQVTTSSHRISDC